jgi:hypothetical protein
VLACAWGIEMGQCSGTRPPPGAVSPSRKREQEAARSNRRESLESRVSVPVTSQWCRAHKRLLTKLRVPQLTSSGRATRAIPAPALRRTAARMNVDTAGLGVSTGSPALITNERASAETISVSWGIATKLGASETGDGATAYNLCEHRWRWFGGAPREWRGQFEKALTQSSRKPSLTAVRNFE